MSSQPVNATLEQVLRRVRTQAANDDCDTCKIAVLELATILADPVRSPGPVREVPASAAALQRARLRQSASLTAATRAQDTQKDLLEYAKQACNTFPAFQDQCVAYVEAYGPVALATAIAYMQPALCENIGFCPIRGAAGRVVQPQMSLVV